MQWSCDLRTPHPPFPSSCGASDPNLHSIPSEPKKQMGEGGGCVCVKFLTLEKISMSGGNCQIKEIIRGRWDESSGAVGVRNVWKMMETSGSVEDMTASHAGVLLDKSKNKMIPRGGKLCGRAAERRVCLFTSLFS